MPLRTKPLPYFLTALTITAASLCHAQSYTFIGNRLTPTDLTPDGTIAVGNANFPNSIVYGFRWSAPAGLTLQNAQTDPTYSSALSVSSDGSVVVGYMSAPATTSRAYRRVGAGTFQDISYAPTPAWTRSVALASNSDGTVIACQTQLNTFNYSTYVWSQSSGFQLLGRLRPQDDGVTPRAISADGSIVAGQSGSSGDGQTNAFLWSADTGMNFIPAPAGYRMADVFGLSSDGGTVLCRAYDNDFRTRVAVFRNGTSFLLPFRSTVLTDGDVPFALSDDGSTIIGRDHDSSVSNAFNFYIWRESTGKINLTDYWASFGITVPSGYGITDVADLSANGNAMLVRLTATDNTLGLPSISALISIPSATSNALFGITLGCLARKRRR